MFFTALLTVNKDAFSEPCPDPGEWICTTTESSMGGILQVSEDCEVVARWPRSSSAY